MSSNQYALESTLCRPPPLLCVCIACALDPSLERHVSDARLCVGRGGLMGRKGKQATAVPCIIILLERGSQGGSLHWDMFYGNRQCLEFCSPLYINLKLFFFLVLFFEEGFGFNPFLFFKKNDIVFFFMVFLNFFKMYFPKKRVCFYKDSSFL